MDERYCRKILSVIQSRLSIKHTLEQGEVEEYKKIAFLMANDLDTTRNTKQYSEYVGSLFDGSLLYERRRVRKAVEYLLAEVQK